ncbi:hypothetical protein QTO34_014670 [Cnephaeus nilssonii]|uniref:Ferritin light chain n=1 Tax=Cnephaeus nilssonii TaxID=3371016 RepID=A0AA40I705_CNENI|nr:hypothetical protein QTO34_014670 [Eptesicus nilssonii]
MEAALALERNLTQALVELQAQGSPRSDPQLLDFRENTSWGVAQNMAGISDARWQLAAVEALPVLIGPDESGTVAGWWSKDCCQPPGQPASAGLPHLPLSGFYLDRIHVALEGKDLFFHKLAEEKLEGADAKPAPWPHSLPGHAEASQDVWAKLRPPWSRPGLGEELTQALVELQAQGSPRSDPQLPDFLENQDLDEQVKLTKKMGNT